ncbi:MAG: peptide deformylase [Anaerolineaceae bacterium]|nr:peptide deformylase [Anaerolineaceae bacterium]
MTVREIITVPHPVLKKKAKEISEFGKELQDLVEDMVDTMRDAPGVGLAAPQIGILQQLVVIEYGDEEDAEIPPKLYVFINPEITKPSEEIVEGVEACLSVPGLAGFVDRHETVTVKGLNRYGKPYKVKASGWLARIFQHEIDHLDGVVFTELARNIWQPGAEEEFQDV